MTRGRLRRTITNCLAALARTAPYCMRYLGHAVSFTSIVFDCGVLSTVTTSPTEGNTSHRCSVGSSHGPSSKMAIPILLSASRRMTSLSQTRPRLTSRSAQSWSWSLTYDTKPLQYDQRFQCSGRATTQPAPPSQLTRHIRHWTCRLHKFCWVASPPRRWCQRCPLGQQRSDLRRSRDRLVSPASSAKQIYMQQYGEPWNLISFGTKMLCSTGSSRTGV